MKSAVQQITDRQVWEEFAGRIEPSSFLHSWEWGEMQKEYGRPIYRFGLFQDDILVAAFLCIVLPLPAGRTYLFSPHGPIVAASQTEQKISFSEIVASKEIQAVIEQHQVIFWRVEPLVESVAQAPELHRVADVEPATTSVLNLSETEEDLLAAMKQKTRYNIRLAEKKGVQVEFITMQDEHTWDHVMKQLGPLLEETNQRHGIRSHPNAYYDVMIRQLGDARLLECSAATHQGDLLAMNIMIQYRDTVTYLHGAATHHRKNVMAPYLLQWRAIQRAKKQGYQYYDFYGISPEDNTTHALQGVTRFKKGFGGNTVQYPGTYEFPISTIWYKIYRTIKRLRSI